ncbi:hypothetical protein CHISP_0614 [Chitinispirillum alkaliphilum]|nr:hypothetical protein CHISP_0614 [Chitinispirillum alkaliphilum]
MKSLILTVALFSITFASSQSENIEGVWFSEEDGLTLTFKNNDSLYVTSSTEESMQGAGTYSITDTTLSAVVSNEDIEIEMNYNFRWKDENVIEAQPVFFSINSEEIEIPSEWLKIVRETKTTQKSTNTNHPAECTPESN